MQGGELDAATHELLDRIREIAQSSHVKRDLLRLARFYDNLEREPEPTLKAELREIRISWKSLILRWRRCRLRLLAKPGDCHQRLVSGRGYKKKSGEFVYRWCGNPGFITCVHCGDILCGRHADDRYALPHCRSSNDDCGYKCKDYKGCHYFPRTSSNPRRVRHWQ